jgi:hypothetical protein
VGKRAQKANPPKLQMPPGWPNDFKVTLAWAGYGQVTTEFAVSLARTVKVMQCPIRLDYEGSCYVHRNRNVLLDRALKGDSTHLMFVDTDIVFPPDGIMRLLAQQKPIIGGAYNLKRDFDDGARRRTTVKALPEMLNGRPHSEWVLPRDKPFECAGLPTGFMLIELDVLRNLPVQPDFGGDREGAPDKGPRNWFDFGNYAGFVGEDIYFCDFVRNQGVPIWCDPTIKLGHIGPNVF